MRSPTATTTPAVSVVIVTKNQRAFLGQSLSILATQINLSGAVEIIVVDSGSTDGAQEIAREKGAVVIDLPAKQFNYARAYNRGIQVASAPVIVRLSGDALPTHPTYLYELLAPLHADPAVAAVWGRQEIPEDISNPVERWAEQHLRPDHVTGWKRYHRDVTVLGSSMAVRRDLWLAHPFEERLPQAEDYAWMHYWLRRGYSGVYTPHATILHGHDESLLRSLRRSLTQSTLQGMILCGLFERGRDKSRDIDTASPACYYPPRNARTRGTKKGVGNGSISL